MATPKKVSVIIEDCGGIMEVAYKAKRKYGTVLSWIRKSDIPKEYWKLLRRLSKKPLSIEDLYYAR